MKMEPRQFLDLLKARTQDNDPTPSVEDMRAELEREGSKAPIIEGISASPDTLGGVACLTMEPANPGAAHILYLHGGGYAGGSPRSHQGMTSDFAARTNLKLWSLDYRLAPEHPSPAALEDILSAYSALIEIAGSADNIIIAGDSAGGGLTIASMMKANEMGLPMPKGLAVMSPWVDLTLHGWSVENNIDKDCLTAPEMLDIMAGWYAGDTARTNPAVSPVFGDLSGLPPIIIHTGSEEVLLSDSTLLAERAAGAGVEVTLKIWPEMPHVFQMFGRFLEAADLSIAEMSDWISKKVN